MTDSESKLPVLIQFGYISKGKFYFQIYPADAITIVFTNRAGGCNSIPAEGHAMPYHNMPPALIEK